MKDIIVLQLPFFKHRYKKLHRIQKEIVNSSIRTIIENPNCGQEKKGDLNGIFVYKFNCIGQQYLIAYEWDIKERILHLLGTHENFYRDLKRDN